MVLCALLSGCAYGEGGGKAAAKVLVSGIAPASAVVPGGRAVFRIKIANSGPDAATGVHIVRTVDDQARLVSSVCSASGGARCPDAGTSSMIMAKLPAGGVIEFTDSLEILPGTVGYIVDSMAVTADDDIDPGHGTVALDAPVR